MEIPKVENISILKFKNNLIEDFYYFIKQFIRDKNLGDITVTLMHATAIYFTIKIDTKITLKCYSIDDENDIRLNVVYYEYGQESSNEIYNFYKNFRKFMSKEEICDLMKEMHENNVLLKKSKETNNTWSSKFTMYDEYKSDKKNKEEIDPPKDESFWDSIDFNLSSWWDSEKDTKLLDSKSSDTKNWWKRYEESKKFRE